MKRETVAKVLIINEKNEALILRTGDYPARPDKSHTPDLPGGMVDPNESEHQAVVREAREEAGIVLDPHSVTLGYAETVFYEDMKDSVSRLLYVTKLDTTPEVFISWEHESYEWTDIHRLLDVYTFRTFYKEGITYLLEHNYI